MIDDLQQRLSLLSHTARRQRADTPPPRLLQGFVVPLAHGLMRYQTMHAGLELSPRAAVSLRKVA
jgi:hypothetical protein